ncbi:MAG: Gfo/Idh/MocA family oxidoreductase [Streptosporangiaceae bacterium]|nr:Gfo/Idh/MocA family oxidoreductase [Streptosporangiaceae bacterium]
MDVVRIGILGTARIIEKALIRAAGNVPEVTVAAVAARDGTRAEAFALRHGIPLAYGSYDELVADPSIDAIYNPLPNSLHGPWTLQAITAGKHVLCEKPFTSNEAEAALVAEAAGTSGLVVMEAMHYRYHPLIRRLREVVRTLGAIQHIQCWTNFVIEDPRDIRYDYALGGGALMDGGCYALDCMRLLTDSGGGGGSGGSGGSAGGGGGGSGGEEPSVTAALADPLPDGLVDRSMAARLAFPGGATGWFESAYTRDGEFRADVHVTCEHGTAWVRNFIMAHAGHLAVRGDGAVPGDAAGEGAHGDAVGESPGIDGAVTGGSGDSSYTWQLRAFVHAVKAGASVETSAAHAVTTMRLIDSVYREAGLPPR